MNEDVFYRDNMVIFSSDDEDEYENYDNKINDNDENIMDNKEIPWVEKYRPVRLDDIIEHKENITILKKSIETGKLQHLLLHGPPGTGKTSTIHAMAYELFGPKIYKERVIELNASDDRGINTVRNNIIKFCKTAIGSKDPNYPCPDFKLVVLDEADAMTSDAQEALRKVLETTSEITRFCFICNYVERIIEPIVSRCMPLKFKPIRNNKIFDKVKEISIQENLAVSDDCLHTLIDMSEGDARKTIMNLQNTQYLIKYKKNITSKDIIKMNGIVDNDIFGDFWNIISKGPAIRIKNLTSKFYREGCVVKSVLTYFMETILSSDLDEIKKVNILLELCNTADKNLAEGCGEYIQLLNILMYANSVIQEKN